VNQAMAARFFDGASPFRDADTHRMVLKLPESIHPAS
jgi:hypothetical protein